MEVVNNLSCPVGAAPFPDDGWCPDLETPTACFDTHTVTFVESPSLNQVAPLPYTNLFMSGQFMFQIYWIVLNWTGFFFVRSAEWVAFFIVWPASIWFIVLIQIAIALFSVSLFLFKYRRYVHNLQRVNSLTQRLDDAILSHAEKEISDLTKELNSFHPVYKRSEDYGSIKCFLLLPIALIPYLMLTLYFWGGVYWITSRFFLFLWRLPKPSIHLVKFESSGFVRDSGLPDSADDDAWYKAHPHVLRSDPSPYPLASRAGLGSKDRDVVDANIKAVQGDIARPASPKPCTSSGITECRPVRLTLNEGKDRTSRRRVMFKKLKDRLRGTRSFAAATAKKRRHVYLVSGYDDKGVNGQYWTDIEPKYYQDQAWVEYDDDFDPFGGDDDVYLDYADIDIFIDDDPSEPNFDPTRGRNDPLVSRVVLDFDDDSVVADRPWADYMPESRVRRFAPPFTTSRPLSQRFEQLCNARVPFSSPESISGSVSVHSPPNDHIVPRNSMVCPSSAAEYASKAVPPKPISRPITLEYRGQPESQNPAQPLFKQFPQSVCYINETATAGCIAFGGGFLINEHVLKQMVEASEKGAEASVRYRKSKLVLPAKLSVTRLGPDLMWVDFYLVGQPTIKFSDVYDNVPVVGDKVGLFSAVNSEYSTGVITQVADGEIEYDASSRPGHCGSLVVLGKSGKIIGVHSRAKASDVPGGAASAVTPSHLDFFRKKASGSSSKSVSGRGKSGALLPTPGTSNAAAVQSASAGGGSGGGLPSASSH